MSNSEFNASKSIGDSAERCILFNSPPDGKNIFMYYFLSKTSLEFDVIFQRFINVIEAMLFIV